MSDSCPAPITVMVTTTVLQGAATSTTNAAPDSPSAFPPLVNVASISASSSYSSFAYGSDPSLIPTTILTLTSAPITKTLNLVSATARATLTTTTSLITKSSSCTTSVINSFSYVGSQSHGRRTNAGSVNRSMASLALLITLLLWCCRRKWKITFKRTVDKTDQEDQVKDLATMQQETAAAVQKLEHNKPLLSPRSFDFGLPRVHKSTSPILPARWV